MSDHAFTVIRATGSGIFFAACACGWRSKKWPHHDRRTALQYWENDHYYELAYHAVRAQIHGRTFHQDFQTIRDQYAQLQQEQNHYDTNPFGQ